MHSLVGSQTGGAGVFIWSVLTVTILASILSFVSARMTVMRCLAKMV